MKRHINYYFLATVVILVVLGLLFLSTLSATESLDIFGNTSYYLFHQLIAVAIGIVLSFAAFKMPLNFLKKWAPKLFFANVIVLTLVFLPWIGTKFWGAKRWISIGGTTFQPSEFLKITAILYLAAWISNKFTEGPRKGWIYGAKKSYHTIVRVLLPFLLLLAWWVLLF